MTWISLLPHAVLIMRPQAGEQACLIAPMQAHGVIGNQPSGPVEVEQAPAVSLTLASMERTAVSLFTVTGETIPDAGAQRRRRALPE